MKIIFVDFDRTLFDTEELIKKMAEIFWDYGGIDFRKTMPQDDRGNYSLSKHIAIVSTRARRRRVTRQLNKLLSRASDFLFEDSYDFLKRCSDFFLILITRGEREYQSKKVFIALKNLRHLFREIVVVEGEKAKYIRDLIEQVNPDEVFFIDDKINELEPVKKNTPVVTTILISRNELKKVGLGIDFVVSNLTEAAEIMIGKVGNPL